MRECLCRTKDTHECRLKDLCPLLKYNCFFSIKENGIVVQYRTIMATLFVARNLLTNTDVFIENAQRKVAYTCIDCGSAVLPRMGTKRVFHFAHKSKSKCKGETSAHKYCKHLLQQNLDKLSFSSTCIKCSKVQQFNNTTSIVGVQEHPWKQYKIDVAILDKTTKSMVGALEVYHTHRSTQTKLGEISSNGIFVSDLDTADILNFAVNSNRISGTHVCADCHKVREEKRVQALTRSIRYCILCNKKFCCTKLFKNVCSIECYRQITASQITAAQWTSYQQKLLRLHEERINRIERWVSYNRRIRTLHQNRTIRRVERWVWYNLRLRKLHEERTNQQIERWVSYNRRIRTLHQDRMNNRIARWKNYNMEIQRIHYNIIQERNRKESERMNRWKEYQYKIRALHNAFQKKCMECGHRGVTINLDNYILLCSTMCYQTRLDRIAQATSSMFGD